MSQFNDERVRHLGLARDLTIGRWPLLAAHYGSQAPQQRGHHPCDRCSLPLSTIVPTLDHRLRKAISRRTRGCASSHDARIIDKHMRKTEETASNVVKVKCQHCRHYNVRRREVEIVKPIVVAIAGSRTAVVVGRKSTAVVGRKSADRLRTMAKGKRKPPPSDTPIDDLSAFINALQ